MNLRTLAWFTLYQGHNLHLTCSFHVSITLQEILEVFRLLDVAIEQILVSFLFLLPEHTLLVLFLHFLELAGLPELIDVIVHFFIIVIFTWLSLWFQLFNLLFLRGGWLTILLNHTWLIFKVDGAVPVVIALQK